MCEQNRLTKGNTELRKMKREMPSLMWLLLLTYFLPLFKFYFLLCFSVLLFISNSLLYWRDTDFRNARSRYVKSICKRVCFHVKFLFFSLWVLLPFISHDGEQTCLDVQRRLCGTHDSITGPLDRLGVGGWEMDRGRKAYIAVPGTDHKEGLGLLQVISSRF